RHLLRRLKTSISVRLGRYSRSRYATEGAEPVPLLVPRRGVEATDGPVGVDLGTDGELGREDEPLVRARRVRWPIPAPDDTVLGLCQDSVAGIAEGPRHHTGLVVQGHSDRLAGSGVPEPRGPVSAAGQHHPAIRAERHGVDGALMVKGPADELA